MSIWIGISTNTQTITTSTLTNSAKTVREEEGIMLCLPVLILKIIETSYQVHLKIHLILDSSQQLTTPRDSCQS